MASPLTVENSPAPEGLESGSRTPRNEKDRDHKRTHDDQQRQDQQQPGGQYVERRVSRHQEPGLKPSDDKAAHDGDRSWHDPGRIRPRRRTA